MFNAYGPSYYPGGYEPYSSFMPSRPYYPGAYARPQRDPYAEARARAIAEQRARRAQWLPDEDDEDEDDDYAYAQLGPRERMYLEARKRQQELERIQREREEQQRAIEEQRWQKQLEQRQKEEDERRRRILEEQRAVQQRKREEARRMAEEANVSRSDTNSDDDDGSNNESQQAQESGLHRSPSASKRHSRIPIDEPASRSSSRSPAPQRHPSPRPSPPPREPTPKPQYGEEHEIAAAKIQAHYRVHKSLQAITAIETKFREMRDGFTYPSALDFQIPDDGHITVQVRQPPPPISELSDAPMDVDGQSTGKLAYTSLNYGIHAYTENMLKLLMQLDGVESWGSTIVRNRRRAVVKEIEAEVQRVDSYWKNAWRDHLAQSEGSSS